MADVVQFKYRAFVSHTHADATVAKRVHAHLQGFCIDKDLGRAMMGDGLDPVLAKVIAR